MTEPITAFGFTLDDFYAGLYVKRGEFEVSVRRGQGVFGKDPGFTARVSTSVQHRGVTFTASASTVRQALKEVRRQMRDLAEDLTEFLALTEDDR